MKLTTRSRAELMVPAQLRHWGELQRRELPTALFKGWAVISPSAIVRRYGSTLGPSELPTLTVARAAIAYGGAAASVVLAHLTAALTGLGITMREGDPEYIVVQMLHNNRVRALALETLLLWIAQLGQGEVKLYAGADIAPRHVLNALHDGLPALRAIEHEARQRVRAEAAVAERRQQQAQAMSWEEYAAQRGLDPKASPLNPVKLSHPLNDHGDV